MNIGKDVMTALGALATIVVLFTIMSGGNINLGTSPAGPFFSFGFKGPQNR